MQVWPYLLRIEFLAAIIVTVILMVWSITLNAPLEEPANPNLTMNPAKAPWYFVGLQEMLVYFDPWFAGRRAAHADHRRADGRSPTSTPIRWASATTPSGSGRWRCASYGFGFLLWLLLIFIGTFIRGPGWMWFWPGADLGPHARDLRGQPRPAGPVRHHESVGSERSCWASLRWRLFYAAAGWAIHKLVTRSALNRKIYERTSLLQYGMFQFFAITILAGLPAKMLLRLLFRIKYVLVTPWFNI